MDRLLNLVFVSKRIAIENTLHCYEKGGVR